MTYNAPQEGGTPIVVGASYTRDYSRFTARDLYTLVEVTVTGWCRMRGPMGTQLVRESEVRQRWHCHYGVTPRS